MLRALKMVAAIALIFAIGIGCDSADNPVAPENQSGQIILTLTVTPGALMVSEAAAVNVSAVRADGNSVAGEMVTLSTNLGSLSETTLTLDSDGKATATYFAPSSEGTATVTAALGLSSASVQVVITDQRVAVSPTKLELNHSREGSRCDDSILPLVEVSNLSPNPIDFRIVDDLPDWLTVDTFTGGVPGTFQAIFTCDVDPGDLDLTHVITVLGTDPVTAGTVGEEATVEVNVHVRD